MASWLLVLILFAGMSMTQSATRHQNPLISSADHSTTTACQDLSSHFGALVSFPGDGRYEKQQARYWTSRQADYKPACRLTPRNILDTSEIMRHLYAHELDFALVSGGHGTAVGASNVDCGVTVDLSSLSAVSWAPGKSLVAIQAGARWKDVYQVLDGHHVAVAGARTGTVGAAGFLLGGGISTLAAEIGWSCDTVTGIETVLANGTVLYVDEQQHPDLFRALKGGGSGFAIPTRFTMRALPFELFQVALVRYEWANVGTLIDRMSVATREDDVDLDSSFDLSLAYDAVSNDTLISETAGRAAFFRVCQDGHPGDLAFDLDESNPAGYRQHKVTMTILNDAATAGEIARAFSSATSASDLAKDPAYRPGMLIQPLHRSQLRNESENSLEFGQEHSALLLLSFEIRWSLASVDDVYVSLLDGLLERFKSVAERRKMLHPFVYLNYAAAHQDPFAQLRQAGKLGELSKVRDVYDEKRYLGIHLKQPFKMWGDQPTWRPSEQPWETNAAKTDIGLIGVRAIVG